MKGITLLIDNYDSYTYNLYQLIDNWYKASFGAGNRIIVTKNDQLSREEFLKLLEECDNVIISPGPGSATKDTDVGLCKYLFTKDNINIPVLGVCLGFQLLGFSNGMKIKRCKRPYHGIVSTINVTDKRFLFREFPDCFKAVRYHSLCIEGESSNLLKTAYSNDYGEKVIMALRHRSKQFFGVQFHPESVCSEHGMKLIENFMSLTSAVSPHFTSDHYLLHRTISNSKERKINLGSDVKYCRLVYTFESNVSSLDLFRYVKSLYKDPLSLIWLDSSKSTERIRYSVIGSPVKQRCYSYFENQKKVVVSGDGKESVNYLQGEETIFSFLSEQMRTYDVLYTEYVNEGSESNLDQTPLFDCGFYGYFGYECRFDCYLFQNSKRPETNSGIPDACFSFCDRVIIHDNLSSTLTVVSVCPVEKKKAFIDELQIFVDSLKQIFRPDQLETSNEVEVTALAASKFTPDNNIEENYVEAIKQCKEKIIDGESYELCLTTNLKFSLPSSYKDPLDAYKFIRNYNPAPYGSYLYFKNNSDPVYLLSSSPERFFKIDSNGNMSMKPIKGTVLRSENKETDNINLQKLQTTKEIAENLMIVDLIRNDMNVFCDNVLTKRLMKVETYETVHQLVSEICGKIRDWNSEVAYVDPLLILKSCFPPGSMTGAPKKRSCELLDVFERETLSSNGRGVYSGVHGYVSLNRSSEFSVVIRSAVINNSVLSVGAGGAITYLSNEDEEYEEMLLKANSILPCVKQMYDL